jgi:hypothetical protein
MPAPAPKSFHQMWKKRPPVNGAPEEAGRH